MTRRTADDRQPKYLRIHSALRDRITSGRWPADSPLPSQRELANRPTARDVDLSELVQRTEGMTPAAIEKVVDMAALDVFKRASESGDPRLLRRVSKLEKQLLSRRAETSRAHA